MNLTRDMREAIEGRVSFTAGEEFSDRDAAAASLQDALRGSALYGPFIPSTGDAAPASFDDPFANFDESDFLPSELSDTIIGAQC